LPWARPWQRMAGGGADKRMKAATEHPLIRCRCVALPLRRSTGTAVFSLL